MDVGMINIWESIIFHEYIYIYIYISLSLSLPPMYVHIYIYIYIRKYFFDVICIV